MMVRIALSLWLVVSGTIAAAEPKRVAILVGDLGNPFFQSLVQSAEDASKAYIDEDVSFVALSSGYDLDRQIAQIERLLAQSFDLILLNAVDTNQIKDSVLRAIDQGTSVVAIDVEAEGAQATVTSDNRQAGYIACNLIAEELGGRGDVVILNGPPVSAIYKRVLGCHDALGAFPEITILRDDQNAGASAAGGLAAMSTALVQYGQLDAVFAVNDPTAIGADMAARQAGRDEFIIVSVDAAPDGLVALRSETSLSVGTVAQDPREMARVAIVAGARLLNGEVARYIRHNIPVALITKEEVR